jgi:hypothetical protein
MKYAIVSLLSLAASTSFAAAPEIKDISLRGLQSGATTTLAIDGERLLPEPQVVLGVPIVKQTVKPGSSDKPVEIEVALEGNVTPGLYQLRLLTPDGISNAIPLGVDALYQTPVVEKVTQLPAAVSGSIAGDQSARVSFDGKQGEQVVIEVEARRLLSEVNPVIHLYDARNVQLAWARGTRVLAGDARLTANLPADGTYTVELHDALYQARARGGFRLKIGQIHYAGIAMPSAIYRGIGSPDTIRFAATNLPADTAVTFKPTDELGFVPSPLPAIPNFSGLRPPIEVTDQAERIELPSDATSEMKLPLGITGRLAMAKEEDRYRLIVEPGSKLRLEVQAARLGSPLDGVITVYDADGKNQLATNDDRPGMADPGLEFNVPAGTTSVTIGIKDLLGRGGEDFVYRVTASMDEARGFSLALADDRVNVPQNGYALVRVTAARQGYDGPIDLEFRNLPPAISAENARIAAGSTTGLVLLKGSGEQTAFGEVKVVGRGSDGSGKGAAGIVETALVAANPLSERQPWLRERFAVALTRPSAIALAWEAGGSQLPLGAKLVAKTVLTRAAGASGPVRLSLVTTQPVPKKTIKENNIDRQVDDIERTLRLEGMPLIAADQSEASPAVIVPADLADSAYTILLRGELLAADGKQVLATAYTPALVASPSRPVALEVTGPNKIDVRAGLGDTGKIAGKVVRQASFTHPVRVMLSGLPNGVPSPLLDLAADKSEFELEVRLPHGTKAGELKRVQVFAASLANAGDVQNAVRTNSVPVTLNVVTGEKPAAEAPLAIFEDDEAFAMALNQGNGQIRLEGGQKYSGTSSVFVTPDQRFNPALSSLGVKIRKEPGPGEYRYLRFVWKKEGGNQLCLQLNHDGQWGPQAGALGKFRYHAGPGECYGASLAVADRPPNRLTVVTRDLYADFGEFTLTGIALSPVDGNYAIFDHIYLGRTVDDLDSVKPQ